MNRRMSALLVVVLLAAGCGSSAEREKSAGPETTLTVFAASSLKNSFTTIGKRFEASHPGATVRFSFGGSQDLAAQINAGAPVDVFAAADQASMQKVDTAVSPRNFATNVLEIAVPDGNPAHVRSLDDLAKADLKVVICAVEVPCGAATASVAELAGITLHPVSREQAVVDVLGKVASGEADAGLVYLTDVKGSKGSVDGIPFAEAKKAVNVYPIARLKDSGDDELAGQFVRYVTTGPGHKVLATAGFGGP